MADAAQVSVELHVERYQVFAPEPVRVLIEIENNGPKTIGIPGPTSGRSQWMLITWEDSRHRVTGLLPNCSSSDVIWHNRRSNNVVDSVAPGMSAFYFGVIGPQQEITIDGYLNVMFMVCWWESLSGIRSSPKKEEIHDVTFLHSKSMRCLTSNIDVITFVPPRDAVGVKLLDRWIGAGESASIDWCELHEMLQEDRERLYRQGSLAGMTRRDVIESSLGKLFGPRSALGVPEFLASSLEGESRAEAVRQFIARVSKREDQTEISKALFHYGRTSLSYGDKRSAKIIFQDLAENHASTLYGIVGRAWIEGRLSRWPGDPP